MEYIDTAEKIFKYFDFNMSRKTLVLLHEIKRKLNFDFNLFGMLIKDYLTIKNNFKEISKDIFSDFLLYIDGQDRVKFLDELNNYARFYRMIIFETDINGDKTALYGISSLNSCYMLEYYPILLHIIYMYYNQKINSQLYNIMIQSLVDTTLEYFANPKRSQNVTYVAQLILIDNITSLRCTG